MTDINDTIENELIEGTTEADRIAALARDDTLLSNENDDMIEGGEGNDTLFRGTGSSSSTNSSEDQDSLDGGAGNDSFFFYQLDGQADQITDCEAGVDSIVVLGDNLGEDLTPGAVSEDQFVIGTEATDGGDRFIYNEATGSLFFNPDGTGATAQVTLVTLDGNPRLNAADLLVI